jgi:hypothetical protein
MKKKLSVVIVMMLLFISALLVVNNDVDVVATGRDDSKIGKDIGLDLDFMWEVTWKLCNATHKAYDEGDIRKGRDFGTKGDNWTANYLEDQMKYYLELENVKKIPIVMDTVKDGWKYNYKIDVIDFNLTINGDNYPFPHTVPKNETFPQPTGFRNSLPENIKILGKMDYNHTLENLSIVPKDLCSYKLLFNKTYKNVSCDSVISITDIMGNATYIPIEGNIPEDQEGHIFLLDEEQDVENQLDNITSNATAVILIHDCFKNQSYTANTSNYNFSIGRAYNNDSNLTAVVDMLKNGTFIIADNFFNSNETFTFTYNLTCIDWPWGSEDFLYVSKNEPYYHGPILYLNTGFIQLRNWYESKFGSGAVCHGIIAYDISNETHLMWHPRRDWQGWTNTGEQEDEDKNYNAKWPALQIFYVNKSIGKWLEGNYNNPNTSICGYFEQADNFVDAYNVIGNITIDHSPNDNITVISNRYDGWWSEAPGDSGLGAGIVMGIAKYFTYYEITPKCDLTFLFTTGEEWGFRGAWHYSHSHPEKDYNITQWIGTDQLGFNEQGSYMNPYLSDNDTTGDIVEAIANETNYKNRTGFGFKRKEAEGGIDDYAIRGRNESCNTICIHKDKDPYWFGHHRTGMNFQEGDSLNYINRTDANVTFEYAWNITKYFTVNPDCWFNINSWAIVDLDDEDNLNDTITVDFDTKSILPHDLAMVKFSLLGPFTPTNYSNNIVMSKYMNFSVNRSQNSKSINITLSGSESPGFYKYQFDLYNSTGRINEIVGIGKNNVNMTECSGFFFLYPYNSSFTSPKISNVSSSPDPVGFGFNVTINADVTSNVSTIDMVTVNISYPDDTYASFNMTNTVGDTYEYVFTDTWQNGQYDYVIWAKDVNGNESGSSTYNFDVSVDATISVCTIKDSYNNSEIVNLTDPPSSSYMVGYEFLDNGEVLHIWNNLDNYYFDTDSGIQLTNHYDEYWSHNVLMLGYYNNDEWNLIYRTDELSGFNKEIESDNETFVNATLWKDLTYQGYDFRLAIRYHLGIGDNELTVIPYIKNIGNEDIPYNLGFAWEIKDIQIDMTEENDYIEIDGTTYYLNEEDLDESYTNMDVPNFYIKEDIGVDESESLYLRWDENLNYIVQVKSRTGQYNAPVTLGIKIGTLGVGQEKSISLFWHDASEVIYYFNDYDTMFAWATNPAYMIDGNTSNYASTTIDRDMEKLNINLDSAADKGAISKVEIRAFGKYSGGGDPAIHDILLKVLGGMHVFSPTTTGNWSSWYDITDNPYAPDPWTWTDIDNLIVEVEASIMGVYTVYCSKVDVRVTYNPNPVISNPYPPSGCKGIMITPVLSITISDPEGETMNITWLSNSSGSWQTFGANISVSNGTYHQTFSNASVNGQWWYWKVNVSDGINTVTSNVFSFYTGYQSKIENIGTTNFTGYLLMQIEFYNTTNSTWILEQVVVNESIPRAINAGSTLALDTLFNPNNVSTSSFTNGNGTYRVYVSFRDPDGDVLVCDDVTLLEDSYHFIVTFD